MAQRKAQRRKPREESAKESTRPEPEERQPPAMAKPRRTSSGRKLDAAPDRIDIRDWFYQPSLIALPDQLVNVDHVPVILDQGLEGACTGFALAAVINFLRFRRPQPPNQRFRSVSPRMLYEMARRYDEWPGENYEGSSARGAMKGWVRHGVCLEDTWPMSMTGPYHLNPTIAEEARLFPGGAFYRVMHREVRDMHAALAEVGILYMTLMVHDGWDDPGEGSHVEIQYELSGEKRRLKLPVIERKGRAISGHAVAIVGYTKDGFIIKNSWGTGWGYGGFALLPYEDYIIHATDVWVAQLGVPVSSDLWEQKGYADTTEGRSRARPLIPLSEIRPFAVNIGNNGLLSDSGDYWTTKEDVERLFKEIIPKQNESWERKRVLFYLHGGLNDEGAAAKRVVAFRDVMLANEIYPVHIMWESGVMETIRSIIEDIFTADDERAANWLRRLRDGLTEARDWSLELTAAVPGTLLWNEMKENARLASVDADEMERARPGWEKKAGGMHIIANTVRDALKDARPSERRKWELHVVGHSAGAIFSAHAMELFCDVGVDFKSFQLLAPAITVDLFKKTIMKFASDGKCPVPELYILSDEAEHDDEVGPYCKSLLYLVSHAFEGARPTPLLGMQKYVAEHDGMLDNLADPAVVNFLRGHVVIANDESAKKYRCSCSDTHGGFDNDPDTLNSVLFHILGKEPVREFTKRDLQY